jgi:hypothetical protein
VSATLAPAPDGAVDVDGPHWILHTTWQTDRPLPPGSHPEFSIDLQDGEQLHLWDLAEVWWNPPERWAVGEPETIDVPDIPIRAFNSWSATWTTR